VFPNTDLKENIMKALKHMEAIFVVAAALATVTSFATATPPVLQVAADPVVAKVDSNIPTVVVAAKRLTAAEKAAEI
jgi:energy-converting hydrogenase Eha subunit E